MLFKRHIAIFLSLTAIFIFLAHAFTPHHQHEDEVCIIMSQCEEDGEHNHSSDQDHHHDAKENSEECLLKQIVFIPANQFKLEIKDAFIPLSLIEYYLSSSIFYDSSKICFEQKNLLITHHPLQRSLYSIFLSEGLSFRAPPVA